MKKCPQCGAPLNNNGNCEYCGYISPEFIRQVQVDKQLNTKESLQIIQNNLDVLHGLPKPQVKDGINAALRIIFAIFTLGAILIVWRKPKRRLDLATYKRTKAIINRNIKLMSVSASNDKALMQKLNVLKSELKQIDDDIKKSLWSKRIAFWSLLIIFTVWFLSIPTDENTKPKILPLESDFPAEVDSAIAVLEDSVELNYYKISDHEYRLRLKIPIIIRHSANIDTSAKSELFVNFYDKDKKILPVKITISQNPKKRLINEFIKGDKPYYKLRVSQRVILDSKTTPDKIKYYSLTLKYKKE